MFSLAHTGVTLGNQPVFSTICIPTLFRCFKKQDRKKNIFGMDLFENLHGSHSRTLPVERFCNEDGLFKQLYSVIEYLVTCLRENVCIPQIV